MTEAWTAVAALAGVVTVLTALFLYVVRAEIDRAMAKLREYVSEEYVTQRQFDKYIASVRQGLEHCPPSCGLRKEHN